MPRVLTRFSFAAAAALLSTSVYGSVISIAQQSSVDIASVSSNTWSNTAGDFVVGDANNVLTLFTYGDGSTLDTITFDGEAADGIFSSVDDPGRVSVAYWLTPSTSATAQLSATTSGINNPSLFYFVELAGVDQSVAATSTTTDRDTITTTVADQFILSAAARNSSNTSTTPSLPSASPLTINIPLVTLSDLGSNTGGMIIGASGVAPTPGDNAQNVRWFNEEFQVALGFTPVPEPGSLALLGLGALMLAKRRRNG